MSAPLRDFISGAAAFCVANNLPLSDAIAHLVFLAANESFPQQIAFDDCYVVLDYAYTMHVAALPLAA